MRMFFSPDSIAVIGASSDPNKIGGMILRNTMGSGFRGKIYPINPRGGTICGLTAYTSVDALGDVPELAIMVLPPNLVLDEMEKIGRKGVRAAVIITAGFREEGDEGRELETKLSEISKRYGIRTVGPNCFGVINTHWHMNSTFSSLFPPKGGISLCSQSGAVGATMLDWSIHTNNGVSKFISLGNKMDVDEADAIDYFGRDEDTKVIGIYSEEIADGRRFIDAVSRTDKPIVVLKAGRSAAGSKAASSHTGALSGSDSVYDAVFDRLNIIRVNDLDGLFDALAVISASKPMLKEGVAVITNAGGLGVMAADACSDSPEISLASLSGRTEDAIRNAIPSVASTHNPVDVKGDATNEMIVSALRITADDGNVGGAAVLSSPLDMIDLVSIASAISDIKEKLKIPVTVAFPGGRECESALSVLRKNAIPSYPSPERAVRALSFLRRAQKGRECFGRITLSGTSGRHRVLELSDIAKKEFRSSLSEEEGKSILSAYGIPVPPEELVTNPRDAVAAAERIGYPVVMKIMSPDIQHKTDIGGVILNIKTTDGVREAFESLIARCRTAVPDAKIDGVSVQKMASGQEVILSMIRDEQFGPVLAFGMGGIYVEILGEISRSLIPMSDDEIDKMIMSTKAYRMLSGARGRPPADIDSLKDIMRKMMLISMENPEIYELEINPVMVGKKNEGSWAVDALTTIR
ncbi:MAG: acetate--CoA ligase family protein [Methanomassiliicoccaceae archaeon]|jgi:acetyltransferase|nr:acetate--CoA ligase family protein [Methanomassiliicoccaceae archaeon]